MNNSFFLRCRLALSIKQNKETDIKSYIPLKKKLKTISYYVQIYINVLKECYNTSAWGKIPASNNLEYNRWIRQTVSGPYSHNNYL